MNKPYWIFGKNACKAALDNPEREVLEVRASHNILDDFYHDAHHRSIYKEATHQELDKLVPGAVHQGVAVRVMPVEKMHLDWLINQEITGKSTVVILDQITDPQNVGAIMRSAAAFGAHAIIVTNRNSVHESGVVAKAAAGALEVIPIIEVANLAESIKSLKKANYWVFAMDGDAEQEVGIMAGYEKVAIVLGSEGAGIRDLVLKSCDVKVKINMEKTVESLNVSNACAIALYAAKSVYKS